MNGIILTQDSTFIIGQVAWLLGKIMEGIFSVLDLIGIPNIGLAIILFTIVVNLLMLPLTIRQQKFSKLSAKMNPELQAISAKYKNKKDNDSMMAQNQEIQAVYAKYGVSPTGSCVQLLIQMPILFALYRVIYAIPAYVAKVREAFFPLVDKLIQTEGAVDIVKNFSNSGMYLKQFDNASFLAGDTTYVQNTLIDCLNKASTAEFQSIAQQYPDLAADVTSTMEKLGEYNNFLGLNIGNSPWYIIQEAIATGAWILMVGAVAIPVLSAVTQWLNTKLIPQQETSSNNANDQAAAMASSMKTMNTIMPIMSAWFCFTLPSGLGIYWIAGSVVRSIQQVVVNKYIDRLDFNAIIEKNSEKSAKKMEKLKENQEKLNAYANMNTRNIQSKAKIDTSAVESYRAKSAQGTAKSYDSSEEAEKKREEAMKKAAANYNSGNAKPGSMMAKANMVKQYNERNNKGK